MLGEIPLTQDVLCFSAKLNTTNSKQMKKLASKPHCFVIHTANRLYPLAAESQGEADEWVAAIQSAVRLAAAAAVTYGRESPADRGFELMTLILPLHIDEPDLSTLQLPATRAEDRLTAVVEEFYFVQELQQEALLHPSNPKQRAQVEKVSR